MATNRARWTGSKATATRVNPTQLWPDHQPVQELLRLINYSSENSHILLYMRNKFDNRQLLLTLPPKWSAIYGCKLFCTRKRLRLPARQFWWPTGRMSNIFRWRKVKGKRRHPKVQLLRLHRLLCMPNNKAKGSSPSSGVTKGPSLRCCWWWWL